MLYQWSLVTPPAFSISDPTAVRRGEVRVLPLPQRMKFPLTVENLHIARGWLVCTISVLPVSKPCPSEPFVHDVYSQQPQWCTVFFSWVALICLWTVATLMLYSILWHSPTSQWAMRHLYISWEQHYSQLPPSWANNLEFGTMMHIFVLNKEN